MNIPLFHLKFNEIYAVKSVVKYYGGYPEARSYLATEQAERIYYPVFLWKRYNCTMALEKPEKAQSKPNKLKINHYNQ